jgi:hypothetical protein
MPDAGRRLPFFCYPLFASILLYGLIGSPTPDAPGIAEAGIGILLFISAFLALLDGLHILKEKDDFLKIWAVFLVCGLVLPALSGAYFANDPRLMFRDAAAFCFFALPLLFARRLGENHTAADLFTKVLLIAGVCFAARTLLPAFKIWREPAELYYLANSPLAMCAAIYAACMSWRYLSGRLNIVHAAAFVFMATLVLSAMLLDVQRAPILAVVLSLIIVAAVDFIRSPKRALRPLLVFGALAFAGFSWLSQTADAIFTKTSAVGLNARVEEAYAVYQSLSREPVAFLTGLGWGATFSSPAVASLEVNFTHSFLTTLLLKGGVPVFLLGTVATIYASSRTVFIARQNAAIGLGLFWSFLIPVFLYASHKSLDFALITLLIGVWSVRFQALPNQTSSDKY